MNKLTYKQYINFLKKYPGLNTNGYYPSKPESRYASIRPYLEKWESSRKSLESKDDGYKDFLLVLAWFEKYQIQRTKRCFSRSHSYHLKHVVEEEFGYITNGAFIAGALYVGCNFSITNNSINPSFNLRYSDIKKTKGWRKQHNLE